MKWEYDFSKGKRGAVIPQTGKTRITIYILMSMFSKNFVSVPIRWDAVTRR